MKRVSILAALMAVVLAAACGDSNPDKRIRVIFQSAEAFEVSVQLEGDLRANTSDNKLEGRAWTKEGGSGLYRLSFQAVPGNWKGGAESRDGSKFVAPNIALKDEGQVVTVDFGTSPKPADGGLSDARLDSKPPVPDSGVPDSMPLDSGKPDLTTPDAGMPAIRLVPYPDPKDPSKFLFLNAGDAHVLSGKLKYNDGADHAIPNDQLLIQVVSGKSITVVKDSAGWSLRANPHVDGVSTILWWWDRGTANPFDDLSLTFKVLVSNATPPPDAGASDASSPDAGVPDSAVPDTVSPDAGLPDSASPDAPVVLPDTGSPDSAMDAGVPDSALPDTGTLDSGSDLGTDSASADAGADSVAPDSASPDSGADAGDAGADTMSAADSGSDLSADTSASDAGIPDTGSDALVSDAGSDASSSDAAPVTQGRVTFKVVRRNSTPAVAVPGCMISANSLVGRQCGPTSAYGVCSVGGLPLNTPVTFSVSCPSYLPPNPAPVVTVTNTLPYQNRKVEVDPQ